jgi:hypothetical protein
MGGFVNEAREAGFEREAPLGKWHHVDFDWGGEFETKERAMARLATVGSGGDS